MKKFLFILGFVAVGFVAEAKNGVVKNRDIKLETLVSHVISVKINEDDCITTTKLNGVNYYATGANCTESKAKLVAILEKKKAEQR